MTELLVSDSMNSCILGKNEYYAPLPILTLDAEDTILDYNIALEVLLGSDTIGWRYQPKQLLLERIRSRLKGNLLPKRIAPANSSEMEIKPEICCYSSDRYGQSHLRQSAIGHFDPDEGNYLGMTVFLELLEVERLELFGEALQQAQNKRLRWEAYAVSYDRVLPHLSFYEEVLARHIAVMNASDLREILDLGAGTGNLTIPLVQAGRKVTAIDISRAMLDKLRSKVRNHNQANLIIVEQNGQHLPQFPNASFDGVTIILTLFDMSDPAAALKETIRVLRPGGQLVLTEPKRCFNLSSLLEHAENLLRAAGLWEALRVDWQRVIRVNRLLDPAVRSRLFVEDIQQHLAEAGFQELIMVDSHFGNCATIRATKPLQN